MRLSRSQLKSIKKQIESNKSKDETCEEPVKNETINLHDVKKALKALHDDSELTQKETINIKKEIKRNLKRKARKENKVSISWDILKGDAVKFKNRNGNEEIGIVLSQLADGEYKDVWRAKQRATIKIMSASGTFWISPTKIEKIDE